MSEKELIYVIVLLLEDAESLQIIEPNSGTEALIWLAKNALESGDDEESKPDQDLCNNGQQI